MAVTPEGKIKRLVKAVLDADDVWYFMPVQGGFGAAGLDYHAIIQCRGIALAFFIETKAPGKEPTDRQETLIAKLRALGSKVFVISTAMDVALLRVWIEDIRNASNQR